MMMQFHHRHSQVKSVIIFKETSYGGKACPGECSDQYAHQILA